MDPERIIVLSDDSSSSYESDSESYSDAHEDIEAAERQVVENVQPEVEREGGEGAVGAQPDQNAPEGRGKKGKAAAVKEERPPPAPLSPGRTPLQEPLCMQTLRFMASLRRVRLASLFWGPGRARTSSYR